VANDRYWQLPSFSGAELACGQYLFGPGRIHINFASALRVISDPLPAPTSAALTSRHRVPSLVGIFHNSNLLSASVRGVVVLALRSAKTVFTSVLFKALAAVGTAHPLADGCKVLVYVNGQANCFHWAVGMDS